MFTPTIDICQLITTMLQILGFPVGRCLFARGAVIPLAADCLRLIGHRREGAGGTNSRLNPSSARPFRIRFHKQLGSTTLPEFPGFLRRGGPEVRQRDWARHADESNVHPNPCIGSDSDATNTADPVVEQAQLADTCPNLAGFAQVGPNSAQLRLIPAQLRPTSPRFGRFRPTSAEVGRTWPKLG